MIQAKIKSVPRNISPHTGHILLLLWIWDDESREVLFNALFESSSDTLKYDLLIKTINDAAERCLVEFREIFGIHDTDTDIRSIESIDFLKERTVN